MSSLLRRLATPAGAPGFEGAQPVPPTATAGATLGWAERLFLGFAFLVLQGAFISMAAADDSAAAEAADAGDARHMIAFALLLLGTAVFARKHLRDMAEAAGANLVYFVLPALIVVSTVWSIEPLLSLKRSVLTVGVCGFDLYIATAIGLDRLLKMLSLSIFVSALASVAAAIAVPTIGREITEGLIGDWRGVFPQKNALGHVMSVGVFIEMALMVRARRLLVGGWIRSALYLFLVAMAHSASSLLSVALAFILSVFYVTFRRGLASATLCVALTLGVLALVVGVVGDDLSIVFTALDRDPSLTGRTELWDYVLDLIREKPFLGWGYMALWTPDNPNVTYIVNQIGWSAPNSHNGYLELALSLGLAGLAGLAVTGVWTFRRVIVSILQRNDLGALLLIITVQMLVANLTESFILNASVFGWNIFSIIVLKTGIALRQRPPAEEIAPASVLDRAKAV